MKSEYVWLNTEFLGKPCFKDSVAVSVFMHVALSCKNGKGTFNATKFAEWCGVDKERLLDVINELSENDLFTSFGYDGTTDNVFVQLNEYYAAE